MNQAKYTLPFSVAGKINYDPGIVFVDFARVFGDHKVSAFLNYLLFRAGFGWGNTPETQCTWLETKKEIQAHTHLTPDEQDRVVRMLTQRGILKVKRAAPPTEAQWQLKNIVTGNFRKGYGLFHYRVNWANPIFSSFTCWVTTQQEGRKQNTRTKLSIAEYIAYKCKKTKNETSQKAVPEYSKTGEAFQDEWKQLATKMAHKLVAVHQHRTDVSNVDLHEVYQKLTKHQHRPKHLQHIQTEFKYYCLIEAEALHGKMPFDEACLDSFFQKIFKNGNELISFFQETWELWHLNKIKQQEQKNASHKTNTLGKIKNTEIRALNQVTESIRQKWDKLKVFLRVQARQRKEKSIPKYVLNQIHFGGFDTQTNTLTFLVPSKYLYEQLESNTYVQFIRQAIHQTIGEGVKLQYMLLRLE
ncbi:hypothetical protein [Microscilla marina]|uniref:DnaA N-terminal domain-containing protein n=1 Tax=Microscilla marina ATCC 23134 TaxID=313606 RepID=A1ZVZ4_MICM2|nr:hypothetical protein [Microscilla marina]EAY25476.1 hypothetical protein M23134_00830 [Microscilla marina ATCC 23134]